jgi:hypothetical protein
MNKLSFTEIVEYLKSKMTYNDFGDFGFDCEGIDLGTIEVVFEEGNIIENKAINRVIWFEDHDVYINMNGYYSTFDDEPVYRDDTNHVGWLSLREVRPFEIIKTIYKKIK